MDKKATTIVMTTFWVVLALAIVGMAFEAKKTIDSPTTTRNDAARAIQDEFSRLLRRVSFAAAEFAKDGACAPGNPADLVGSITQERAKELGCSSGLKGDYIPKSLAKEIEGISFERRWDGLATIKWKDRHNVFDGDCLFIEAERQDCRIGVLILPKP